MPRILIAISSCESFETSGLNQTLRDTWLPEATKRGIDYKFFHGEGSRAKDDVVVLHVDDGIGGLTDKAKAKLKWAYECGYDFVFSCFPDTYVCCERLLSSGFEKYDYFGRLHQHPDGPPYCQGGPGYFLSRKACEILFKTKSSYLNDDCWIGDVMHNSEICREGSKDFSHMGPGPLKSNTAITNHLSTQPGGFTKDSLAQEHRRWLDS